MGRNEVDAATEAPPSVRGKSQEIYNVLMSIAERLGTIVALQRDETESIESPLALDQLENELADIYTCTCVIDQQVDNILNRL